MSIIFTGLTFSVVVLAAACGALAVVGRILFKLSKRADAMEEGIADLFDCQVASSVDCRKRFSRLEFRIDMLQLESPDEPFEG